MFNKFKSLFGKEAKEHDTEENDDFGRLENPNFITEPEKIASLLLEIEQSSPLCTVQIDGAAQEYASSILGIKKDKNLVILDELVPAEGNAYLQHQKALKLSTYHRGINLSFNLSQIELGHSHGISYYRAPLPSRVYYPQRRSSPRIEISTIDVAFSGVSERTGLSVSGYLFDLSRGGAGIDIPVNRARIQRGDTIKNCQITIDDHIMDFEFMVRFVKPLAGSSSKVQIGGLFEKLSSKSQTKLSHFITSLERIQIRKQKA